MVRPGTVACGLVVTVMAAAVWSAVSADPVGSNGAASSPAWVGVVPATVVSTPLAAGECASSFVEHQLDHITTASDIPVRQFDSNGSGVAADDLDGNGFIDIVLGNLEGRNTILWNEGGWRFTTEKMTDRGTRAINLIDVDADGLLDIVTTHRGSGVAAWRNLGNRAFEQTPLSGVGAAAYSMSWADADADGDLDVATGSYDAELDQRLRSGFLFSDGAGIYMYRRDGDEFTGKRLAEDAQALSTMWLDLDLDGAPELLVGNDFAAPDITWRSGDDGWVEYAPFTRTAAHPMSLDAGDIDNDGIEEIYASDMKPTSTDVDVLAMWMPFVAAMEGLDKPAAVQRIRSVLQVNRGDGTYAERSDRAGIDVAGWAWSARFGDLDNDGDNDLSVVNGMIAAESFPQLPNAELVEENVTFVNDGEGHFATNTSWGLASTASGRGSILTDLDNDGRLDLVVNNLSSPAVAFENRLCEGRSLEIELGWTDSANTHALGASVTLNTDQGTLVRHVRGGGGYLSGSSTRLHFGLGSSTGPVSGTVRWPDGRTTELVELAPDSLHLIDREDS